jgi:hypothetical protein
MRSNFIWLLERSLSLSPLKVDRASGTIFNVKIIGFDSENNRKYLPNALKEAKGLYENVKVNIDHPKDDPTDARSAYDRFGKLVNIRYVEGKGLFGDLVYLKSHPMANRIIEAAERMPEAFGLSHNAQGEGEKEGDIFVVNKVTEVRHVDLVADPATTKSLSEAAPRKPLTPAQKQKKAEYNKLHRKKMAKKAKTPAGRHMASMRKEAKLQKKAGGVFARSKGKGSVNRGATRMRKDNYHRSDIVMHKQTDRQTSGKAMSQRLAIRREARLNADPAEMPKKGITTKQRIYTPKRMRTLKSPIGKKTNAMTRDNLDYKLKLMAHSFVESFNRGRVS